MGAGRVTEWEKADYFPCGPGGPCPSGALAHKLAPRIPGSWKRCHVTSCSQRGEGNEGPRRESTKLVRQAGPGGGTSRAPCSARQLGPPGPVGPMLLPKGFGMEKRPGSFLAPHPLPEQVMEGLVSRLRPPGRCGELGQDPGLPGWPLPRSSVLRGPHKPPCLQLPSVPLSLRPQWGGRSSEDALSPALPSSWLLEGQAPAAWVLLELDLLQGEDGGSVWELVHTLPQGPEVGVVQGCLC